MLIGSIKTLDWDSQFFGYPVGKIEPLHLSPENLKAILANLRGKIKLAYWFVDPKDKISNEAAKENGGFLLDRKTTYLRSVPRKMVSKKDSHIKSILGRPLNRELCLLALEAGEHSRFKLDPNCDGSEFEKLYIEWIRKSLSGEIAKDVLVYREKGRQVGFITLGEKGGRCNIGLIAVSPEFRTKGIGKKLIESSLKKAGGWGYRKMDVVTQGDNIAACKFYEQLGFKLESVVNVYHFWL